MSEQTQSGHFEESGADIAPSRFGLRLIFAGVAMMALASGLMWWKFGPSMFMSLVTAAANCF